MMGVNGTAPDYISNLVTLTSAMPSCSHLRPAGSLTFDIPQTRTRTGDRVISVAGPQTFFLSFFFIRGDISSLCMPALRPASQAGPMRNPREGTSVVLGDTIRLT